MKGLFPTILLLLLCSTVMADVCHSGSWYNPENDGEGIQLEVLDTQIVVYHFQKGRWRLLVGPAGELEAFQVSPGHLTIFDAGSGAVTFVDENRLIFSYDYTIDVDSGEGYVAPWCIGCVGSELLTRLTQPIPCE